MANDAFTWGYVNSNDANVAGLDAILLIDTCYDITDITDGAEIAAAIASNDIYLICPTMAELPEPETQFIDVVTSRGSEQKPVRKEYTLTFESYETADNHANAKLIDGSTRWRIATINTVDANKRVMRFYDKQTKHVIVSVDDTGNAQDNFVMIKGSAVYSMPIKTGSANQSNGERYDITANTALIAAVACPDADCA